MKTIFRRMAAVLIGLAVFVFGVPSSVMAASCSSNTTGDWNAIGTWSCGYVPTSIDDVIIQTGHTVTITQFRLT